MSYIPDALRALVTERADGLCEYCQTAQAIVVTMVIDHILPVSAGGETNLENLCLTCTGCNQFKSDYQTGIDPVTQAEVFLFNPRTQSWSEHFAWNQAGVIQLGLTDVGRATVERLKINRPLVVAARKLWAASGWHPPKQSPQSG